MLTEDDIKAIEVMMAALLEAHGMKKAAILSAEAVAVRMRRYRNRKRNDVVTRSVTKPRAKRNAERNESVTVASPSVVSIPLNDGSEFGVTALDVKEFEALYPAVDVPQTLREIRGWNLTRPTQRKTRRGIMKHINHWLAGEQNKG